MARPVKWSRDLHVIRERAFKSKTETWARQDIERLFNIGRASAQAVMKAIGEVQAVGAAHFVERSSLLFFLDEMIAAESVEVAFRTKILQAEAPPTPKPLCVALPATLRNVMVRELPATIALSPGSLMIRAADTTAMLESLALLARALQNDLDGARAVWEPVAELSASSSVDIDALLLRLRRL